MRHSGLNPRPADRNIRLGWDRGRNEKQVSLGFLTGSHHSICRRNHQCDKRRRQAFYEMRAQPTRSRILANNYPTSDRKPPKQRARLRISAARHPKFALVSNIGAVGFTLKNQKRAPSRKGHTLPTEQRTGTLFQVPMFAFLEGCPFSCAT